MNKKYFNYIKEWINSILFAIFFAFLFQTFLYQPFKIPSGSMIPNLQIGDFLFVKKFAYGYNNSSFSFWVNELNLTDKEIKFNTPRRGDVIVFNIDADNKHYIKRVIGLPGDTIKIVEGQIYINGVKVKRKQIATKIENGTHYIVYEETLPGGIKHKIYKYVNSNEKINFVDNCEYVVPPERFFCMGDNRDNSRDSRYLNEIGYVKRSKILGKAVFLFFTDSVWKLKTDRLFTVIK